MFLKICLKLQLGAKETPQKFDHQTFPPSPLKKKDLTLL